MDKKSLGFALSGLMISSLSFGQGLNPLSDDELSVQTGQALFNLSYIAPSDATNLETHRSGGDNSIGFYKLGMEGTVELNANIKNLQLGCGGVNGAASGSNTGCDIDIKNLSLSGAPSSYDSAGNPVYSNAGGRAATSATLTNPFIQFAIKNANSASTRQVVGFRLSAESINGLLTAGTDNTSTSSTDGIQSLSGYMQITTNKDSNGYSGTVNTQASTFGKASNQTISGLVTGTVLGIRWRRGFESYPNDGGTSTDPVNHNASNTNTSGISLLSQSVGYTIPDTTIKGRRLTNALINNVKTTIASIPLSVPEGSPNYGAYANDQLYVNLRDKDDLNSQDCVAGLVCNAKFKMDKGSALTNLNLNVTFNQSLSMIHNLPLSGTGAYLALQQAALQWPGANSDDIAQQGWWMSFQNKVNLGYLAAASGVQANIDAVLPQVAKLVSQKLAESYIDVGEGGSWNAVGNNPIYKKLVIDVGDYTTTNPATITLSNLKLANQNPVANCYGSLKFC